MADYLDPDVFRQRIEECEDVLLRFVDDVLRQDASNGFGSEKIRNRILTQLFAIVGAEADFSACCNREALKNANHIQASKDIAHAVTESPRPGQYVHFAGLVNGIATLKSKLPFIREMEGKRNWEGLNSVAGRGKGGNGSSSCSKPAGSTRPALQWRRSFCANEKCSLGRYGVPSFTEGAQSHTTRGIEETHRQEQFVKSEEVLSTARPKSDLRLWILACEANKVDVKDLEKVSYSIVTLKNEFTTALGTKERLLTIRGRDPVGKQAAITSLSTDCSMTRIREEGDECEFEKTCNRNGKYPQGRCREIILRERSRSRDRQGWG